ncbi:IME4 N6-adenosine-methyltransferase IME4 [Candida maltosa Xu316]|uniref:mRNA m(6)A methyltransferase n=1 Tax=Candida maltosa (strain Xu316) TaxID=1245528 RepID=M3K6Y1_CANMX|nr:N6-adenosine-methyltransferase, putative [Candida maltosa Xu316]
MIYDLKDFGSFVQFILKHNDLLDTPVYGQIWIIGPLFQEYSGLKFTNEEFVWFLIQFNMVSGGSLKFDNVLIPSTNLQSLPKLVWINLPGILILQSRLQGKVLDISTHRETTNSPTSVLDFIQQPDKTIKSYDFLSPDTTIVNSFKFDKDILFQLLNRPTSRTQLNKDKAKRHIPEIPFYHVCNEQAHSQLLASMGLNKKEYSHFGSKHNIPEDIIIQRILKCKSIISNEVFRCFQEKIHFLPIINNHTDLNLGDCSYLDTCHKMKTCRYLHYYTLNPMQKNQKDTIDSKSNNSEYTLGDCFSQACREVQPPQWINCDVRYLPFPILGKFAAIISDPAWDIHMSLPYGTCKDDELLSLPMHELQDEGIIMLWVTGRSIEVGRRALLKWGYKIYDEMIWIKLNQLRRTIVTGRTGHWLNHSKEHLLVGLKGDPIWINKKIDTDVVVSPTRETSRKPDEFYDIVERLVGKHSRKLEIFGRDHNTRPGWLTIGNQLQGVSLTEPELKHKYELYKQTSTTNS